MKFGLVDGIKSEALPKLKGVCSYCKSELIAKCGKIMAWHWAHKAKNECDDWWERESEWHRAWKNHYDEEWQEVVHFDANGEKHIADVKRPDGFFIEIQHSRLDEEEIHAREKFYHNMVWIVDGSRCQSDLSIVCSQLKEKVIDLKDFNLRVLRNWKKSNKPIFIDFRSEEEEEANKVFYLAVIHGDHYLYAVSKVNFIEKTKIRGGLKDILYEVHSDLSKRYIRIKKVVRKRKDVEKIERSYVVDSSLEQISSLTSSCIQSGWHSPLQFLVFEKLQVKILEGYYNQIRSSNPLAKNTCHHFNIIDARLMFNCIVVKVHELRLGYERTVHIHKIGDSFLHEFN